LKAHDVIFVKSIALEGVDANGSLLGIFEVGETQHNPKLLISFGAFFILIA
jgi:hypothetical protein